MEFLLTFCMVFFNYYSVGIIFSNGQNWREMRRFVLSNLRDFGMGKRGSEEKIIKEIQHLKEGLEKFNGKTVKHKDKMMMGLKMI